jgi:hypothetical protein
MNYLSICLVFVNGNPFSAPFSAGFSILEKKRCGFSGFFRAFPFPSVAKENDTMKTIAKIILAIAILFLIAGVYIHEREKVQKLGNFPFEMKYRKSLTGNGYVDQIFNNSGGSQPVKVTLNNPTLNQTKVYSTIITRTNSGKLAIYRAGRRVLATSSRSNGTVWPKSSKFHESFGFICRYHSTRPAFMRKTLVCDMRQA